MSSNDTTRILGFAIQYDASGQGHAWRTIDASELPAGTREEIAAEIVDGNDDPDCYVSTDGQHYRW